MNRSAAAARVDAGGFRRGGKNDAPDAELCCGLPPASSLAPRCGWPAAPPWPSWKAASAQQRATAPSTMRARSPPRTPCCPSTVDLLRLQGCYLSAAIHIHFRKTSPTCPGWRFWGSPRDSLLPSWLLLIGSGKEPLSQETLPSPGLETKVPPRSPGSQLLPGYEARMQECPETGSALVPSSFTLAPG